MEASEITKRACCVWSFVFCSWFFVRYGDSLFEAPVKLANKVQNAKYKVQNKPEAQTPKTAFTRNAAPRADRLSSPAELGGNKPRAPQKSTQQTPEQT